MGPQPQDVKAKGERVCGLSQRVTEFSLATNAVRIPERDASSVYRECTSWRK